MNTQGRRWPIVRLKHLAAMKSGSNIVAANITAEGPYPVFGGNGLRGYTTEFTHHGNHILVGRQGALCGNVHRVNGVFWASEHAVVTTPTSSVDVDWLYYKLCHMNLNQYSVSAAQPGLAVDRVRELPVRVPPEPIQRSIAEFLDRKTAAIDALIEKKQKLLDLLTEKRAALISQAVTKGLDPTVPMKDSGIPWLGDIPAHWEVKRLKHLGQVRGGITKGQKHDGHQTTILPYLRVANVQDGHLDLAEVSRIEVRVSDVERFRLCEGDILMNEGGDNDKLGRGAVWEGNLDPCLHQNHVFAVRPKSGVDPYWINLTTQAAYLKHFFYRRANQSTNLASISASNLKEAPVLWPPADEQRDIKKRLAAKLQWVAQTAAKTERQIVLLTEYRQALITAAVTGQLNLTEGHD